MTNKVKCNKAVCPCWGVNSHEVTVGIMAPGVSGTMRIRANNVGEDLHIPYMPDYSWGIRRAVYKWQGGCYRFSHVEDVL